MSNWTGKHYDLISSAKDVYREAVEDLESSFGNISIEDSSQAFEEMENKGVFYVSFRPDFTLAKTKLCMGSYVKKTVTEENGVSVTKNENVFITTNVHKRRGVSAFQSNFRVLKSLWGITMSKEDKKQLRKNIQRNAEIKRKELAKIIKDETQLNKKKEEIIKISSENAIRSFFAKAKMDFGFIVGFVYPDHIHNGIYNSIPYSSLVLSLLSKGYDPLLPIRKKAFVDSVNRRMGEIIISVINDWILKGKKGRNIYKTINRRLTTEARLVVDFARDYIYGGAKPALDAKTIQNRKYYSSLGIPGLYGGQSGIYEPLVETGDLALEVDFVITSSDTEITPDDLRMQYDKETFARSANRMLREHDRLESAKEKFKNTLSKNTSIASMAKEIAAKFEAGDDDAVVDIVDRMLERETEANTKSLNYKNLSGKDAIANARVEFMHRFQNLTLLGNLFKYFKGGDVGWDVRSMPENLKEDFMAWFEAFRFLRANEVIVNIDRENMRVTFPES